MIALDLTESIATFTLDKPKANAMDRDLLVAFAGAAERAAAADVRAVVITGKGSFFSAGLDLKALVAHTDAEFVDFARAFDRAFSTWFDLDKPVVAAVNGHAIAGGGVIAALADFRIAGQNGKIGLPEVPIGFEFPTAALEPVLLAYGGRHLREIVLRGRSHGMADALALGLVDEVVAEPVARALELARELAAHPPLGFAAAKRALRREARARIHAAIASAGGPDPIWAGWRAPDMLEQVERYTQRMLGQKAARA